MTTLDGLKIDPRPVRITRTTFQIYVKQNGVVGLSTEAETLNAAKDVASYKAEVLNLPILHLGHDQNIKAQVDDGVYIAEERTTQISVPV